jgi:hypothetical protein
MLETFMPEKKYFVEYYTKSLMVENDEPSGPYGFSVVGDSLEKVMVKAVEKLMVIGFTAGYSDVYNARLIDSENKSHEILRESSWLVDSNTGKRLSDLEKKV